MSLPKPYYSDDKATIYHARCEDVLPEMEAASVDLVATDPPYFRVKNEAWDRAWKDRDAFLLWLGGVADEWRRVLKPNGSLYCFAGPKMAARVEVMLSERFNVLNRARWIKSNGWHKKNKREKLRSYLAPWEEVVFAEQYGDCYADASDQLRGSVFEPLRVYLDGERKAAGFKDREARARMGLSVKGGGLLAHFWGRAQWALPTSEQYAKLKAAYPGFFLREYEELRREYEELRREYEELRRPFFADPDATDVWTFPTVSPYPGKHPCEKPVAMMERIVSNSSRPDALVLDCFMGSGSTMLAALNLGRRFVGIEADERWCEIAASRLSQESLTLETASNQ